MDAAQLLERAKDVLSIKRVFGEPIEHDGVLMVPVAIVLGGGGGGMGTGPDAQEGGGGGFALVARPVGVYVIKNGNVSFEPTIDVSSIVFLGLILFRTLLRRRSKRKHR